MLIPVVLDGLSIRLHGKTSPLSYSICSLELDQQAGATQGPCPTWRDSCPSSKEFGWSWEINHPRHEMSELFLISRIKGKLVGLMCPTAGGTNELDYALVHSALEGCFKVSFSYEVPFRPHGAVHFILPESSLQQPVSQLKTFPVVPETEEVTTWDHEPLREVSLVTQVADDPASKALGELYRQCEQKLALLLEVEGGAHPRWPHLLRSRD